MPAVRRQAHLAFTQPGPRRGWRGLAQRRTSGSARLPEIAQRSSRTKRRACLALILAFRVGRPDPVGAPRTPQHGGSSELSWNCLRNEVVPYQMEENRRGKAQRVNAIQNSAVSFDDSAEILDPDVPLDRAHYQAPAKSQNANRERHPRGLQRRKWCGPPERRAQRRSAQDSAEKPFPSFVRTHAPRDFVPADQFAPLKLQDVAHLIHDHQIEQQPRILPFIAWNL